MRCGRTHSSPHVTTSIHFTGGCSFHSNIAPRNPNGPEHCHFSSPCADKDPTNVFSRNQCVGATSAVRCAQFFFGLPSSFACVLLLVLLLFISPYPCFLLRECLSFLFISPYPCVLLRGCLCRSDGGIESPLYSLPPLEEWLWQIHDVTSANTLWMSDILLVPPFSPIMTFATPMTSRH